MWTSFLQEELFEYLNLNSPLELAKVLSKARKDSDYVLDPRAIQEISNQDQLIPVILDYNKQEKHRQFERNSYTCKVCFCEKVGTHCVCFEECGHVYCMECMRDYFSVQIQEGNVKGLECPEDKCESQAHPTQVLYDFSLTVKEATLILISGRGLAISSAKEGKLGFIHNLVKS